MSIIEKYCDEITVSLAIIGLLVNITILVRIKYGDLLVTHLSVRPYLISLAFFILVILMELSLTYIKNIVYAGDLDGFWKMMFDPESTVGAINYGFTLFKIDLVIFFILTRTYE